MTTVGDILTCLEEFAPYSLAESWDNVGLMVGDRAGEVMRVLCALDATETVLDEAGARGAQLVVAHHPLIFTSVQSVTSDTSTGRSIIKAVQDNIAVICMHTNADCAQGGVNDALADVFGLTDVISMGAGENKMLGRVGDLREAMLPAEFALFVKQTLQVGGVRYVDGGRPISRVAVGGGACGKMMDDALRQGAQAFVIGDSTYDQMQRAESLGLTLIDAGHYPTENPVVPVFARRISQRFPHLEAACSAWHADCIHFV